MDTLLGELDILVQLVVQQVLEQEDVAKHDEKDERRKIVNRNVQIENVHRLEELNLVL